MVTGRELDYGVERHLPLVLTPPPMSRHAANEVDDGSWTLLLPESHDFSAMSSYLPEQETSSAEGPANSQEIEQEQDRCALHEQFICDSTWQNKNANASSAMTAKSGSGAVAETLEQNTFELPYSSYSKSEDLALTLTDHTPECESPSYINHAGVQGTAENSTKLTKEERALRRRAFHKIHTRRSRAKLNDKMEHLRQVLPSPPPGMCVKSKAQILDWAIACASAQNLSSTQDMNSSSAKIMDDFQTSSS